MISESDIENLIRNLKEYTLKKYHFVFLIKPSAAATCQIFREKFLDELEGETCGIEPIYEDEEIK